MSGRFVHQEKVGRVEEEFDEGKAGFFSPAEDADRFENIVPAKEKGTENGASGLLADGVGGVKNRFKNLVIHIERIAAVLGEVADANVVA